MAISVNWPTGEIYVPKSDLTLVQLNPIEIRELNINWFRLELKALEDDLEGIGFPKTHTHNTEVQLGGLTYARVVEILHPYTITFEDGPYAINLVGANSNIGDVINFNQVSVRSSNSGGLISNSAIEYSSFNGGVTVDVVNGKSGTVFPSGTPQQPVNNIPDAKLIATYRGFNKLYIIGDIILDDETNLTDMIIEGQNANLTAITVNPIAIVINCEFREAVITGTLDGGCIIRDSIIYDLRYVNGVIFNSMLNPGTIHLDGGAAGHFISCYSGVPGLSTPTIDLGESGQALAMRNYAGGIKLINKAGSDSVSVDMASGQVILDSTITNGDIVVRGVGQLFNYSNGATVYSDGLISKKTVSSAILDTNITTYDSVGSVGAMLANTAYNGTVFIKIGSGYSGTTYPIGTKNQPVNNLEDAATLMNKYSANTLRLESDVTFNSTTSEIKDATVLGYKDYSHVITMTSSANIDDLTFINCSLTGTMTYEAEYYGCQFENYNGIAGYVEKCVLKGSNSMLENNTDITRFVKCISYDSINFPELYIGSKPVDFLSYLGLIKITNKSTANDITLNGILSYFYIDSTCTAGSITLSGRGRFIDMSGVGCTINTDYVYNTDMQTDKIWEAVASAYTDSSTMGGKLNTASSGGVDYDALADAVWNEDLSGHTIIGSAGASLNNLESMTIRILGLNQENFRFFGHVYDDNGNLTSANIRIYPTSNDVENNTNHTDAYRVLASYTDGKLSDYQVLKI